MIPLIFPKVPQSSLGILRVPQLPPPLESPLKNPITIELFESFPRDLRNTRTANSTQHLAEGRFRHLQILGKFSDLFVKGFVLVASRKCMQTVTYLYISIHPIHYTCMLSWNWCVLWCVSVCVCMCFFVCVCIYVGVSKNNGTPKSSILIGFSIINHPFWGTPIFGNTHVCSASVSGA